MNAGACTNPKCNEYIDIESCKRFPIKCEKCDETITEKHYQLYKDIMHATRMHLDTMQTSSTACKLEFLMMRIDIFQFEQFL